MALFWRNNSCFRVNRGLSASWVILELGLAFEGIEGLSPVIALIAGYAGGDFLENIFKILMKKPILFGGLKDGER